MLAGEGALRVSLPVPGAACTMVPFNIVPVRGRRKAGSAMATAAHQPGALLPQGFSLSGCPTLHGLLLNARGVVFPCLREILFSS